MLFRKTRAFSQNLITLMGLAAIVYIFFNLTNNFKSKFYAFTPQLFHYTYQLPSSCCHKNESCHEVSNTSWTYVHTNKRLVLVFLHIQKSAGSFIEKQFTRSGVRGLPCACRPKVRNVCDCKKDKRIWLFSRFSVGWRCGLHADFTELSACVPQVVDKLEKRRLKRVYAYFTILRDPIQRYLSEWQHVRRGATWRSSTLRCNGKVPAEAEYRPCFLSTFHNSTNLSAQSIGLNISLGDFASCKFNLANNRETRMLASLDGLGCYAKLVVWSDPFRSEPVSVFSRTKLLRSAITNLATRFVVFGLTEYLIYTQYLYQSIFGMVFNEVFAEPNTSHHPTHAELSLRILPVGWKDIVISYNVLDIELLKFAHRLFSARLSALLLADSRLSRGFRLLLRSVSTGSVHGTRILLVDSDFNKLVNVRLFRLFRLQKSESISVKAREAHRRYWNLKLKKDWSLAGMSDFR